MKSAINMNCTRKPIHTTNEQAFADKINDFYRRFDTQDSSSSCDSVLSDVFVSNADRLEIDVDVVIKSSNMYVVGKQLVLMAFQLFY